MPSVRLRRGSLSQYTVFGRDDDGQDDVVTRPRSRTLNSIFRPQPEQSSSSDSPPRPIAQDGGSPDPQQHGKVSGSILGNTLRIPGALRDKRSRGSLAPGRSPSPATRLKGSTTFHGSQEDVVIPREDQVGRIGSSFSLSSSVNDRSYHSSNEELNHEDNIVEHLDVIGEDSFE